jgi:hypothetical protein
MPKFEIHIERVVRARASMTVDRDTVDEAIAAVIAEAEMGSEHLVWGYDEEPVELVEWKHGSGEN